MSDISRVIWESQENTKQIAELKSQIAKLEDVVELCRTRHEEDQTAITAITRILDRIVATVDMNQVVLEKRVARIEDSSVES